MTTKILNIKSLLVILAIFLAMSTIAITPAKALIYQDSDCIYPNTGFKNGLLIVVKNTDGTFAEGANVKVYNLSDKLVDSGTTGKYGRFFTILPKGNYYVVAEKDGSEKRSNNFYLRLIERVLITLPEQPTCTDVTVYVEPLGDYMIWIENATQIVAGPSPSNGSGDFTACLEDGTYNAFALLPNGSTKNEFFTEPGTASVTITFP